MKDSTADALVRSLVGLIEFHKGECVLLHSGYGGGQYVGKLEGVTIHPDAAGDNFHHLVDLNLGKWVERYQPASQMSGRATDDQKNWLPYGLGLSGPLPLKEEDRLYSLGKSIDLEPFKALKEPIDPELGHASILTGSVSGIELLYGGAPLKIVK